MPEELVGALVGPRTELRPLQVDDASAVVEAVGRSVALHRPWARCPDTVEAVRAVVERTGSAYRPLLLVDRDSGRPAGMFTFSQVVLGNFQSAYLGYAAFVPFAGTGRMSEGMELALRWGFERLGLHRVEANIQPGNTDSIRLVERVGFVREGFSPAYLFLEGAWRDHERWAIRLEMCAPRRTLTGA